MTPPISVSVSAGARSADGTTRAWVISDGEGVLVDPAASEAELDRLVKASGISHVAVTHHHSDHVGGVAAYARRFDLTVWARNGRETAFEAATGVAPDRTFRPGDPHPGGGSVIPVPGHTVDHVAFSVEDGLISGDVAVADGSVVIGQDGDMRAYLSTLRRLIHARPSRLYPAHGKVITDSRGTCRRLLVRRRRRERAVVDAISCGAHDPDEIVDRIYDDLSEDVRDLARATVQSHLEKLAVEDRVPHFEE